MSDKNYSKIMKEVKQNIDIDKKLDELSSHLKKIEELKSELINMQIDKLDSEERTEQRIAREVIENPIDNPIQLKIQKEEQEIKKIKEDIKNAEH